MAVLYKWSQKGSPDRCERSEVGIRTEKLCYHCGTVIRVGETAVCLTTDRGEYFLLHKDCAEKSCKYIND